jgi:hypothetical protein
VLLNNHRRLVKESGMVCRENRDVPPLQRDVAVPPGYTGVAVEIVFAGHGEIVRGRERRGEGGFDTSVNVRGLAGEGEERRAGEGGMSMEAAPPTTGPRRAGHVRREEGGKRRGGKKKRTARKRTHPPSTPARPASPAYREQRRASPVVADRLRGVETNVNLRDDDNRTKS